MRLRLLAIAALAASTLPAAAIPSSQATPGVWRATLPATGAADNLSAFADGTAYATVGTVTTDDSLLPEPARGGSVGFFKSTDFGQTWVPMAPPPIARTGTSNLYVRFATPKIGYATYNAPSSVPPDPTGKISGELCLRLSSTFRTADGGETWSPICEPRLANGNPVWPTWMSPLAVGRDGQTVLLTGTEDVAAPADGSCEIDTGVVNFSTTSGVRWTRGTLPKGWSPGFSARIWDRRTALVIAYHDRYADDCSSIGDANGVFLTTDAGRTWRLVHACPNQPLCTSVAFVSATRFLVGKTDGSTAVTGDAGRTWRSGPRLHDEVNEAAQAGDPDRRWWHWVQAFSFADAQHGYASTRGAGTWRTDDGGRSWTQEQSHECVFYPYGIGENATATPSQAITGGPGTFSARTPAPAGPGPCHPERGNIPVPAGAVALRQGERAVRLDGALTR